MKKELQQVKEFHQALEHLVNEHPTIPDKEWRNLRQTLIREELDELKAAEKDEDLVEVADALTDILYLVYGTIISYGFGDAQEELFQEVHQSNMSKLDNGGEPIKREDGKILRTGEDYFKPDIESILEKYKE